MLKTIADKIQDFKCSIYLKRMKKTHEAFSNYGLSLDYKTYMEFNKEILVRKIVQSERLIEQKNKEINGVICDFDNSEITEAERIKAFNKILVLIDQGILNKESLNVIDGRVLVL